MAVLRQMSEARFGLKPRCLRQKGRRTGVNR
jgi:hypothetical protein